MTDDLADLFLADWLHLTLFGAVDRSTADCLKTADKTVNVPRLVDYDTE